MGIRTVVSNSYWRVRRPQLTRSFGISSHLTFRERVELFELAKRPGIQSIVEIGSYLGASATAFAAGLETTPNRRARIYCIDTWRNDAMTEGSRETMAAFLANIAPYREVVVPVRGWSTAVVAEVRRQLERIDLLFVDGDHSYDGCLADWTAYRAILAPKAAVVFHDVGWAEGVQRVIHEEVRKCVTTEVRLPNLWWGELR